MRQPFPAIAAMRWRPRTAGRAVSVAALDGILGIVIAKRTVSDNFSATCCG
jgi:hypothetical protein